MSYRRHPSKQGWYQIIISQGRKGKKLTFTRECDEAEAATLDKQLNAMIKGRMVSIEPTIVETLPDYIKYYKTIATPLIVSDMASVMRRCLLPVFGKLMPKQIGRTLVHQYISDRLNAGVTHRTVEKELNYLSAMCRWMFVEGRSTVKVEIPRPPKAKTRPQKRTLPLTLNELSKIILQLPPDRLPLVLLMSDAGLRCQEALRIRCEDIDLSGKRIIIKGKGGKVVVYPILSERLLFALQAQKGKKQYGWLTVNEKQAQKSKTEAAPYKSIKTLLKLAAKRAGIEKSVTHHVIRHTYSTILMELGVSAEARKMLMRHSSLATTEHYTHTSPEYLEQQAGIFTNKINMVSRSREMETADKPARILRLVK